MVKRLLCIILTAVCVCFAFTGCQKSEGGRPPDNIMSFGYGEAMKLPMTLSDFCAITYGQYVIISSKFELIENPDEFDCRIYSDKLSLLECAKSDDYILAHCVCRSGYDVYDYDGYFINRLSCLFDSQSDEFKYVDDWKRSDGIWGYDTDNGHKDMFRSSLGFGRYGSMDQLHAVQVCDKLHSIDDLTDIFADSVINISETEIFAATEKNKYTATVAFVPVDNNSDKQYQIVLSGFTVEYAVDNIEPPTLH